MRKRFEQQLTLGQLPIEETEISIKNKSSINELLAALKEIYCTEEYNQKIFNALEQYIPSKNKSGRPGMNLWCIFVLGQVRLCSNASYAQLHDYSNNHKSIRQIMGVEKEFGYDRIEFEYQNIYDNVTLLTDEMLKQINAIVVEFGHKVFKKKEETALRLKTDTYVIESNVHFPTDYNLLWDSARKCLDIMSKFLKEYPNIEGWRKIKNWNRELKGLMRELGKTSSSGGKNKAERLEKAAQNYLGKARKLANKLQGQIPDLPVKTNKDLNNVSQLLYFTDFLEKHIDLVHRRIIEKETIPHDEKIFSIFETYTEWIKKGKVSPNVELGKKLAITTSQYNLITDYQIMERQSDSEIVVELADRILAKYTVLSWSFDKGFWNKDNKEMLKLEIPEVIMPKLGKRNANEEKEEKSHQFKKLKNKHSAIESNINELEQRGLDRCPDRGIHRFKSYVGLGVCAYNLKKIGKQLLKNKQLEEKLKASRRKAA